MPKTRILKFELVRDGPPVPTTEPFEIRVRYPKVGRPKPVLNATDVYELFREDMESLSVEEFRILCLDAKKRPLGTHVVSRGSLTSSLVHPREVFRAAICAGADAIVCAHNHPSGDAEPSFDDIEITSRLVSAGHLVGIEVCDHLVIGRGGFISMRERGQIASQDDGCR